MIGLHFRGQRFPLCILVPVSNLTKLYSDNHYGVSIEQSEMIEILWTTLLTRVTFIETFLTHENFIQQPFVSLFKVSMILLNN